MRSDDVARAVSLGAAYVGAVFAGGPRRLTAAEACAIFGKSPPGAGPRRVGVFGAQAAADIAAMAAEAALDVVQLHGESPATLVESLRRSFGGEIWRVLRVGGPTHAAALRAAFVGVEGVVVDALVEGQLGGAGVTVDWQALAGALDDAGRPGRFILAGGLTAANVREAVRVVAPDVVDVSSGVEAAPGIKDHELMRAFIGAAQGRTG